ncbi:ATP-binding cassette, subfamily B [Pseudomonas sp. ok272]|uniref:ATP-binding cassette domain-containing protein n=1 Tax=unclassified Pseudomonas TaxID=196821 RepID=UPI0008C8A28C|nr:MULTISPECIES: ATP-binding cassette domain-containing protein [unclassified Pseudomonas]SEN64292.1 ATP-binding cassette, subfamily B [Pseudomonas sp. ok272]SFN43312.1 ATP-binding cassette, subfamily B [Pseudomonas sp. ok602]
MQTLIATACKNHRMLLITTTFTIIVLKIIALVPPWLLGEIIDSLNSDSQTYPTTLILLTIGFVLAGVIQALASPLQTFLLSKLVQQTVMKASINWIAQLMRKEFMQFSSWRTGHFIKSIERGINAHEQLLTFFVTIGFSLCLEFTVIAVAFFYMGGIKIFLSISTLGVIYLFFSHTIIRWRRKHIDSANQHEDELSATLFNTLTAGKTIKLECAEPTATLVLNRSFEQYAKAATIVASSGGFLNGAKILFISLSTGGILYWGVNDQLSGSPTITVGQLVAIFSITGSFLLNITSLTEGYRVLDQFLADQRRLQHLLSLPNFDNADRHADIPRQNASTLVLNPCVVTDKGIVQLSISKSVTFKQQQTVAITGPSGAGKSTLLEALAGLNASTRSQLSINNTPVSLVNAQAHLNALRYCPQMPQFIEGPFIRSVLLGLEPSPHLHQAVQRLNLEGIVSQRNLSEGALNISGGEAKRLSLLRLINKPGTFNLFDEPSASIEPKLVTLVWDLLFETFSERGLICVTHDVQNLHRFDRVIVMHNGTIIDEGPWCELVNRPAIALLLNHLQSDVQREAPHA